MASRFQKLGWELSHLPCSIRLRDGAGYGYLLRRQLQDVLRLDGLGPAVSVQGQEGVDGTVTVAWQDKGKAAWQQVKDFWGRFKEGMAEVILSVAGSVGILWGISALQALDDASVTTSSAFLKYFEGGQVGLTVLAVAGAALGTLLRLPLGDRLLTVLTGLLLLAPIIGTAVIIGRNPGFASGALKEGTLTLLWGFYILVHVLWLLFIMRKPPEIPNSQEVGKKENERVRGVKERAAGRA